VILSVVSKNILLGVKTVGSLAETEGLIPTWKLESQGLLKMSDINGDLPKSRQAIG
jgi:hypothetical protein